MDVASDTASDDTTQPGVDSKRDGSPSQLQSAEPRPLMVKGVALADGEALAVESIWAAELRACPESFSVDFVLSNGLTVVVDHPSSSIDNRWHVVAKDAIARFWIFARFQPRRRRTWWWRALIQVLASPLINDLSAVSVLLVALVLVGTSGADVEVQAAATLGGSGEAVVEEARLLRTLLLLALGAALLVRGARKLQQWSPPKGDYTLSVKVSSRADRAEEHGRGLLKRTLSDIFLSRQRSREDVALLGHSLINRVTTAFLGCIAPLATEFERREPSHAPPVPSTPATEPRGAADGGPRPTPQWSEGGWAEGDERAGLELAAAAGAPGSARLPRESPVHPAEAADGAAAAAAGLGKPAPPQPSAGLIDGGQAGELELRVGALLEAFGTIPSLVDTLCPSLVLAIKNDEGNIKKLRKAWARQIDERKLADPHRCASVRGLLEIEKGSGVHKPGGILADPSAAMALLWMRRSLQFLTHLLHVFCHPDTSVSYAARSAYGAHLEAYHGWVLRQTYQMALGGMPRRDEALGKLYPRVPPAEREVVYALEAREAVLVLSRVVDAMRTLFEELDLEDVRKAPWI